MKFRECDPDPDESEYGTISNILYENIYMDQPSQWAIWMGPAQQFIIDSTCSLLWPQGPSINDISTEMEKRPRLRGFSTADVDQSKLQKGRG